MKTKKKNTQPQEIKRSWLQNSFPWKMSRYLKKSMTFKYVPQMLRELKQQLIDARAGKGRIKVCEASISDLKLCRRNNLINLGISIAGLGVFIFFTNPEGRYALLILMMTSAGFLLLIVRSLVEYCRAEKELTERQNAKIHQ